MAITLEFTWRGVVLPNAYVRLDDIRGSKLSTRPMPQQGSTGVWHSVVGIYADSVAATQHPPVLTLDVSIPFVTDEAPMPLLYAMLKTMPEFSGAIDC